MTTVTHDIPLYIIITRNKDNNKLGTYGYYIDRKVAEKDVSKLSSNGIIGVIIESKIITA